jgi:hypothetical protein
MVISVQSSGDVRGPVEQEMVRGAVRYAQWLRLGIATVCVPLGTLAMPTGQMLLTLAATVGAAAWAGYLFIASRDSGFSGALLVTDMAVTCALCLTQILTVPRSQTWVGFLVSGTVITHQWHQPWRRGLGASAVIVAADLAGVVGAGARPWDGAVVNALWVGVQAMLSALALALLYRGARQADRRIRRAADARSAALVAAARRDAERDYLTALHDTACATLLLASTAPADRKLLSAQARRDLLTLGSSQPRPVTSDLVTALMKECSYHALQVVTDLPRSLDLPAAVTTAVQSACAEALRNAARHAGVETVSIRVVSLAAGALVEVTDAGMGFDPDSVGTGHRGLEHSVRGRMQGVGGRATVKSRPGAGTTVRLEWLDAT